MTPRRPPDAGDRLRRARRPRVSVVAASLAIGAFLSAFGLGTPAIARSAPMRVVGVAHPSENLAEPRGEQWNESCTFDALVDTSSCTALFLAAVNRAHRRERVPPMVLPTNYLRLSVPQQLLVVTDLERVDRGLPPVVGLTSAENASAAVGARRDGDPPVSPTQPTPAMWRLLRGGVFAPLVEAIWAGGNQNPVDADFAWMYDDGWGGAGSANLDCTSPTAVGCWGHRDAILGVLGVGARCRTCVAGAAYASHVNGLPTSFAMSFVDPRVSQRIVFAWNSELPDLPGYEQVVAPTPRPGSPTPQSKSIVAEP